MSSEKLTEAEIIQRLQLIREHGSASAAARFLGVAGSSMRTTALVAKSLGLTADTKIKDETARLKAQLKLQEATIRSLQKEEDTAEAIRKLIYGIAERPPEPPQWTMREGRAGQRGTPVTCWSDWHWGETINASEIGGVNEFNVNIAKARAKRLVESTISLCFEHMGRAKTNYPGIVICLGGDMIGGDLHEELAKTNDRTPQQSINDVTDTLAACIETMASKFNNVFLPCVVGNHGRATKKPQFKQRVHTSLEWNIYCNLERYFKKERRIQFFISPEADAFFKVYGHRYILTHGDSLGVKGGDGIIGSIGPIMRGTMKLHRSEAQIGRDFDTGVICHWHQYLTLPGLIVNNSFKGYDEFARLALRAPYSRPSQALWFTHPEHGITAHWQVYLEGSKLATHSSEWCSWLKEVQ
jgi:hypothetical protein